MLATYEARVTLDCGSDDSTRRTLYILKSALATHFSLGISVSDRYSAGLRALDGVIQEAIGF